MKTNKQLGLTFDRCEVQEDGSCEYTIARNGEEIGTITKDVVWCGEGHRANAYSVVLDLDDRDESLEFEVEVRNVWNHGRDAMDARAALAACKAFVREQCEAYDARKAETFPEGEGPEGPVADGLNPLTGAVDCKADAPDPRRYVAIGRNYWGKGDTPAEAIKNCRRAGARGRRGVDIHVLQLPEGSYDAYVDQMGGINWKHPRGRESGRGVWVVGGPKN